MTLNIILLTILIFAALWTVMTRSLLRSAIGLALTSAVLSIIMFKLGSPLAAVFELSVCTGLISVIFISAISLTQPLSFQQIVQRRKDRLSRFLYLPFILVLAVIVLYLVQIKLRLTLPVPEAEKNVRFVLWSLRTLDLTGQVIVLLAGVYGVVILFREMRKK